MLQCAQLVQHTPQRPYVRLEVVSLAGTRLRAQVVRCTDYCRCQDLGVLQHFRDAEISQLNGPLRVNKDILRLNVPVEDLMLM